MRGVRQTIFGNGNPVGNCTQAAVASLMEMELHEVPHFAEEGGPDWGWYIMLRNWLREKGLDLMTVPDLSMFQSQGPGYVLGVVKSPRGDWPHNVVCDWKGNVVWDPHPSDASLGATPIEFDVVIDEPYEPAPEEQVRAWREERTGDA